MKNKLFYMLFAVYILMVVFILYINGVFTGEVESFSNLAINGVFLVIIGILFMISSVSFIRLNRVTGDLKAAALKLLGKYRENGNKNIWMSAQEDKDIFREESLKKAFGKYCLRVKNSRSGRGYINVCDIEEYINEELLDSVGRSYFNSGISGTLTGLGILGTFLGLSLGLGAFNGDDIYTISDNVGPLLSGMKVAFHTSVYGIFFSLVFNFVYRSIMADAYEKLEFFLNSFKQCALPPAVGSEEETASAMLVYQANQAGYLKQLLELARGESKGQSEALKNMVEHFVKQLQSTMGAELQGLGDALNASAAGAAANEEGTRKLLEAAETLAESNRKLQENMMQMQKQQEMFARELEEQKKTLSGTLEEIERDISTQLYTFEQMKGHFEAKASNIE